MKRLTIVLVCIVILATFSLTGCDTTPPVISGVTTSNISSNGAIITWTTNELSTSQVEYGTNDQYGKSTTLDKTLASSHNVTLTGLNYDTTYYFRVLSQDEAGNQAISSNFSFTTPDVTPPVISDVVISGISSDNATITWMTNELATSQIEYGITDKYGMSTTLNKTLATSHNVTLSGLDWETIYHLRVKSNDKAGNQAITENFIFTTTKKIWTDGHMSLTLDKVLRSETWPDDISWYGGLKPTQNEGNDFVCIYLTVIQIKDVIFKNDKYEFPLVSWELLDIEGKEYSAFVYGTSYGNTQGKVIQGSKFYGVTTLPKIKKPVTLKIDYEYKLVGEENFQKGELVITIR